MLVLKTTGQETSNLFSSNELNSEEEKVEDLE